MSNQRFFKSKRTGETHSFNINLASHYSIEKAILLQDLLNFCTSKMNNNKLKKGLPLVYYSSSALQEKYRYMKSKSIARWLKELEDDGILFSAIANKMKYDRTKSYVINFEKYDTFSESITVIWSKKYDLEFKKYCENAIEQSEKTISQNEKSNTHNEESISQSEKTIPNQTTNQTTNHSSNSENSENSDYIDFNSLLSQGAKIGLIGQAKAILQTELNCLVFDDFDNKIIQRMLNSIKSNLKAFKHKKGDYSSVTTKNVIDAFKTSVNAVKSNSKQESISLNYLNSCLTTDLYINADKKQVNNDDLSIYQDVVKQTFKHYNRFTAFDKAKLREIIAAIEEAGAENVYAEFKSLFANLPAYILNSRSYQSVSFVASKINDLMNITSTDAQIRSYHNYTLLKESYGEDRAREMISKILKNKQNESSKVH